MVKRRTKRGEQDITSDTDEELSGHHAAKACCKGDTGISKKQPTKRGASAQVGNGRTDEDLRKLDPKTVKRILANRQSAAKSKERKQMLAQELERRLEEVVHESMRISMLQTDLNYDVDVLQTFNKQLEAEVESLTARLSQLQTSQAVVLKELTHALKVLHLPPNLPALPQPPAVQPPDLPPLRLARDIDPLTLAAPMASAALESPLLPDGSSLPLSTSNSGPLPQLQSTQSSQLQRSNSLSLTTAMDTTGNANPVRGTKRMSTGALPTVSQQQQQPAAASQGVRGGVERLDGGGVDSMGGASKGSTGEWDLLRKDAGAAGLAATSAGQLQFGLDGTAHGMTPVVSNQALPMESVVHETSPTPSSGLALNEHLAQTLDIRSPACMTTTQGLGQGLRMPRQGHATSLTGAWSRPALGEDECVTLASVSMTVGHQQPVMRSLDRTSSLPPDPTSHAHADLVMRARQASQQLAVQQQQMQALEAQVFGQALLSPQQQQQQHMQALEAEVFGQQQQQQLQQQVGRGQPSQPPRPQHHSASVWPQLTTDTYNTDGGGSGGIRVTGAGTVYFSSSGMRRTDNAMLATSAPAAAPASGLSISSNGNLHPTASSSPVTGGCNSQSGPASGGLGPASGGIGSGLGSGLASESPFVLPPRPTSGGAYHIMGGLVRSGSLCVEDGPSSGGSDVLVSSAPFQRVSLMGLLLQQQQQQQQQAGSAMGLGPGMATKAQAGPNLLTTADWNAHNQQLGAGVGAGAGLAHGNVGPQLMPIHAPAKQRLLGLAQAGLLGLAPPSHSRLTSTSSNPLLSSLSAQQQLMVQQHRLQLQSRTTSDLGTMNVVSGKRPQPQSPMQQQQQQQQCMDSSDHRLAKRKSQEDGGRPPLTNPPPHHRSYQFLDSSNHSAPLQPPMQLHPSMLSTIHARTFSQQDSGGSLHGLLPHMQPPHASPCNHPSSGIPSMQDPQPLMTLSSLSGDVTVGVNSTSLLGRDMLPPLGKGFNHALTSMANNAWSGGVSNGSWVI